MEPTFYADILFFAAVAGFIAYRLYTVLGRKDGTEQNITHRVKEMWEAKAQPQQDETTIATPDAILKPTATEPERPLENVALEAQPTIRELMGKDRSFNPARFLENASGAFEIVLRAFAEGDKDTLKNLLEPALFEEFSADIEARKQANQTLTNKVLSVVRAEIAEAQLQNGKATLTVAFESEQLTFLKDASGVVLSGDEKSSDRLHDRWVFTRELAARSPIWLLTDTDAE